MLEIVGESNSILLEKGSEIEYEVRADTGSLLGSIVFREYMEHPSYHLDSVRLEEGVEIEVQEWGSNPRRFAWTMYGGVVMSAADVSIGSE